MNKQRLIHTCDRHRRPSADDIEARLTPGAGSEVFRRCRLRVPDTGSGQRRGLYSLVSFIKAAIRERAVDHNRSTERDDTPSASADSSVVRPAK